MAMAGGLLAGVAAAGLPASASQVTVALDNPGGSRTLYVEDLLGQPLTTLDLGTARSQAFRVRVVDTTMDRTGFEVMSSMSNLYKADGQGYDFGTTIPSKKVWVDYGLDPVNAQGVAAVVTPLYNLSATVPQPLCGVLTSLGGSCTISMSSVEGVRQALPVDVDLSALPGLPLVPQMGETGTYDSPDYAGIAANDPAKPAQVSATTKRVLSGDVGVSQTLLDALKAALDAKVAGTPVGDLVSEGTLTTGLRNAVGGSVYDSLTAGQVQGLIDLLNASALAPLLANVVAQTGTYLSFPNLHVTVPTGTPAGAYKGTLVVTAIQK
jgi:hypothetical protein